jgi:hypothetical protein
MVKEEMRALFQLLTPQPDWAVPLHAEQSWKQVLSKPQSCRLCKHVLHDHRNLLGALIYSAFGSFINMMKHMSYSNTSAKS